MVNYLGNWIINRVGKLDYVISRNRTEADMNSHNPVHWIGRLILNKKLPITFNFSLRKGRVASEENTLLK